MVDNIAKTPFDASIQAILNSDQPDDLKAKQYSAAINQYRSSLFVTTPIADKPDEVTMEILDSVPYQSRHKAKRLLRLLRENPEVGWNEKGELIYRQSTVSRSHVADLIANALKTTKGNSEEPIGSAEFSRALASSQVPRDLIPNYKIYKTVRDGGLHTDAYATPKHQQHQRQPSKAIHSGRSSTLDDEEEFSTPLRKNIKRRLRDQRLNSDWLSYD